MPKELYDDRQVPLTTREGNSSTMDTQASQNAPSKGTREALPRWTFLTNHAHVLAVLDANPEIVLRQVASQVGITERAVQRIVQDLEDDGFIKRERVGRRNQYRILKKKSLRHPIESHRKIGDLLALISVD